MAGERAAIGNLSVDTIVGPVRFKDSPVKNVSTTSMAGGQWRKTKGGRFPFELLIVYNATAPQIPIEAELKLLSQLSWLPCSCRSAACTPRRDGWRESSRRRRIATIGPRLPAHQQTSRWRLTPAQIAFGADVPSANYTTVKKGHISVC